MIDKFEFNGKIFGDKLKKAIKEANFTQEAFAEHVNISKNTLVSYLNGGAMPKADNLMTIAKGLNTTVENLLCEEEAEIKTSITPIDIINAINVLVEAYGCDCIKEMETEEIDLVGGYPQPISVNRNAICISEDYRIQKYLENLRTKGHLRFELLFVGEKEAYNKLLNKWANIDDCIFENGFIYNPHYEEIDKDSFGQLYLKGKKEISF